MYNRDDMPPGSALPIKIIPITFVLFVVLLGSLASFATLTPNPTMDGRPQSVPSSTSQPEANRARSANLGVVSFVILGVVSSLVGLVLARTWVAKEYLASKGKVSRRFNSAMVLSLAVGEFGVILAIVAGFGTKSHLHWIAVGAYVLSITLGVLPLAWSLKASDG
ncbi:MAG: hypothetical protein UZ18_ATM001000539 [Armatimonadetes bacterium OLB18]|nr:MAG: hypothetical protein UZ18_ATM001000539 [Armatimonadetes bacterium OLB18]RIJ99705.1 MAG: hypothetical protein DCC46_07140 [Armatimonadota bacterium]